MGLASLIQAGALVLVAFVTALAALLASGMVFGRRNGSERGSLPEVAYLFDGGALVDATPSARRLLKYASARGTDIARLVAFLSPRFPDLHKRVLSCGENDRMLLLSADNKARLRLETRDGKLRVSLEDVEEDLADLADRHSQSVLAAELEIHRSATDHIPVPVWRLNPEGVAVWANGAYWSLADRAEATGDVAPGRCPILFPNMAGVAATDGATHRLQLSVPDRSEPLFFDAAVESVGTDRIVTAIPADTLVNAERNLREFIQTLTQTFAHLSVGLAIFDRRRELTLFNPALGDLLGLSIDFMIARPSLIRFLDRLRERHMMPEPKDYKTWRQQMSDLEAAAVDGGHSETWPLADGRTLRITGRPHPDGAVAFLFEDISAEIRLSREYRVELETGRAVIDSIEEAIAIFTVDGRLNYANRAYVRLWGKDEGERLESMTFVEASRTWQENCMPSPIWGDARDFAAEMSGRSSWTAEAHLGNGHRLACRFEPLPGGATMAGFTELPDDGFAVRSSSKNGKDRSPAVRA